MIYRKYIPIIKTGESELKAIRNLSTELKAFMLPLFELTKARKKPKEEEGSIKSNIEFLQENFKNSPFILDLTSDDKLSNTEIDNLLTSQNDYENWVNFCLEQKKIFDEFYPTVAIVEEKNEEYSDYINKLENQLKKLCSNFKHIVFRAQNEAIAKNLILDINNILKKRTINNLAKKIIFVLDYRYINNSLKSIDIAAKICKVLYSLGVANIVISSTSFPKTVSEYMNTSDFVKFKIKEFDFYRNIKQELNDKNINLIYSDYATVNPVRNDNVVFARGWIPRIDVSALDEYIYCRRMRRDKKQSYADVYKNIAKKIVRSDYYNNLLEKGINGWGIQEILNASNDNIGGSSPRYWISVRMNIYIEMLSKIINTIFE